MLFVTVFVLAANTVQLAIRSAAFVCHTTQYCAPGVPWKAKVNVPSRFRIMPARALTRLHGVGATVPVPEAGRLFDLLVASALTTTTPPALRQ
jgi:hypothetical protein